MTNDLPTRLTWYLKTDHTGQEKPITAGALAKHFETSDRAIRDIVHELRKEHVPICSGPRGFYWPASREDAAICMAWISHRFQEMKASYEGFKTGLDQEFGEPNLFNFLEEDVA